MPTINPTWTPLWEALKHVQETRPGVLPTAAVVAVDQPEKWTLDTAERVHLFFTRNPELLHGYHHTVDSLPQPARIHHLDRADATSVTLRCDGTVPEKMQTVLAVIPGLVTFGEMVKIPVNQESIPALRKIVAENHITITDSALTLLRDPPDPPATVTLTARGAIVTRTGRHEQFEKDILAISGTRHESEGTHAVLITPKKSLVKVSELADRHGVTVSPEFIGAVLRLTAPFEYDGTLEGLKGVPLTELEAVTSKTADGFHAMGLDSVFDLLMHVPRRYLDRSHLTPITQLSVGEESTVLGRVTKIQSDPARRLSRFSISDNSGTITVTFFNAAWQAKRFKTGDEVVLLGQVDEWVGASRKSKQMTNPIMDPVGDDTLKIIPVYPQSAKSRITTWDIVTAAREAISRLGELDDPLPASIISTYNLIPRIDAYRQVHFPQSIREVEPARTRLAFDELFRLQAALQMSKAGHAALPGTSQTVEGELLDEFLNSLPFPLTAAQRKAWAEISQDLQSSRPMNRLLQGDVGSGKTLLAAMTIVAAHQSGNQSALMAPTEILATQLYQELTHRLTRISGRTPRIEILTNKVRGKRRTKMLEELRDGTIDVLVGTHALLVDDVEFRRLGVVVVDEQHRFGVEQRALLRDKVTNGIVPDTLVMTATPIPRTAAMTVFGDLDVSVLDELPPGRTPIATEWIDSEPNLDGLALPPWDLVRAEVANGRQAYVVCPLVTESDKLQAANAEETFHALSAGALNGLSVGLVHGQQKSDVRSATMEEFIDGKLNVLVATTVIEVGVNVPNASVMVILDAGRFGIAQLHQLRGRVGRGQYASHCTLVGRVVSPDGRERMRALCQSTDGFYLSEVDLKLRGHGSILGTSQSGVSDLRVADLETDNNILEQAREAAESLMSSDPNLSRRPQLRSEITATLGSDAMSWLSRN